MINKAAQILNVTASEIRSRLAKLAHHLTGKGMSQSAAWKKAWATFKGQIAAITEKTEITLADKLDAIIDNDNCGSWAWNFATDNLKRIMEYGDKAKFSAKQIAKIEELYAEV